MYFFSRRNHSQIPTSHPYQFNNKFSMAGLKQKLTLDTDSLSNRLSYLSPTAKRSLTTRSTYRINFTKSGFSSPKCVRATHEVLLPTIKPDNRRNSHQDISKSIVLNNRRIGENLLLDTFPTSPIQHNY